MGPFDYYLLTAICAGILSIVTFTAALLQLRDDESVNRGKLAEVQARANGEMLDALQADVMQRISNLAKGEIRDIDKRMQQQGIAWARKQEELQKLIESRSIKSAEDVAKVRKDFDEHLARRHRKLRRK